MTVLVILLGALAGGLGAVTRVTLDSLVMRAARGSFPWGTLVINVVGSFVLGILAGLADSSLLDAPVLFVAGAGFLGGFTTFSTAMVDTVRLIERRQYARAVMNGGGMLLLGLAAALAGVAIGRSV